MGDVGVELPGFVDAHTHLLRVAARARAPYDVADPGSIARHHRSCGWRSVTPMDEPYPYEAHDLEGEIGRWLERAASLGLVEVWEAGLDQWAYLDALQRLRDRDLVPLRVRLLVASGIADVDTMRRLGDERLEIEGVKFYADGWLGPRTCALCDPFADEPDSDGVLFLDDVTLARRAEPFAEAGWTIATHAIGDRAIEAVLDAYDHVYGSECATHAPRIEHAQVLAPHLVERMAHMGVVACIQPAFAVSDAPHVRAALGPDRAALAYHWAALLEAGVRVITGSDFPIESLPPLEGLQKLATGADLTGPVVAAPLGVDVALGLMTDAAAGVTVLDADPRDVDPQELHTIQVMEVRPA